MRLSRLFGTAIAAGGLAIAPFATASAATAATYHGTFTSVTYDCESATSVSPASGTWNVSIRNGTVATATFNIFVDGVHHLAYGVPGLPVTSGDGWSFSFDTLAGTLVVSYDGSTFSYAFPDGYDYGGLTCQSVTYLGS